MSRAIKRGLSTLALVCLMVSFGAVRAYADTYVGDGDDAVSVAMSYLGYDPNEGESTNKLVSAFIKAYDGTEPYEGYEGWQTFVRNLYQPLDGLQYNEQWWSLADGFLFSWQLNDARADAQKIYEKWKLSGGGNSGGGLPDGDGSSVDITLVAGEGYQDQFVTPVTGTWTIRLTGSAYTTYMQSKAQYPYMFAYVFRENYSRTGNFYNYTFNLCTESGLYTVTSSQNGSQTLYGLQTNNVGMKIGNNGRLINPDSRVIQISTLTSNTISISNNMTGYWLHGSNTGGGGGTEPEPEPQPPETPEPPEGPVVEPPDPPLDPIAPSPDPTVPSPTIDLQGIIDRLDIIIRNQQILINWLDDAFASVNANIQWLGGLVEITNSWLSSVVDNIQWLGNLIDESFGWLWQVLDEFMASVNGGFSQVITWLEMIYSRLGGTGGPVSRPPIDTPDPWGKFFDWLKGILDKLLDFIFGITPAALQELLTGLADLTRRFPFSIPWDIAGMLALFAHSPVTPVFDIPLATPFDTEYVIHIDCTPLNSLAVILRDGEALMFAAWLAFETPTFYRHLSDVTGGDD